MRGAPMFTIAGGILLALFVLSILGWIGRKLTE